MLSVYIDIFKNKIKGFLDGNISVLAIVFNSNIDKKAVIRKHCRFYNSSIGKYSYITQNCLIQNTEIGRFCSISENCIIGLPSHPIDMVSTSPVFLKGNNYLNKHFAEFDYQDSMKTHIGNDVWIGSNVLIKDGLSIGDGVIIAAGSVVTKDIKPYSIVAGVPAVTIRKRFDDVTISKIQNLRWWDWDEIFLNSKAKLFDSPSKIL